MGFSVTEKVSAGESFVQRVTFVVTEVSKNESPRDSPARLGSLWDESDLGEPPVMFVFRELRAGKTSFVSSGVVVNQKEQLGFHRALRYVILTPAIELEEKYEGETNEKRHYKQGAAYNMRPGTRTPAAIVWLAPRGNRFRAVHASGGDR